MTMQYFTIKETVYYSVIAENKQDAMEQMQDKRHVVDFAEMEIRNQKGDLVR